MIKLTWEDVEERLGELADKIKSSGFEADYLIGIANGGLIPLYFVARKLGNTENVLTVTISSYDKDVQKDLRVLYLPNIDLAGKKILLIDEIAETGNTLKEVSRIFKEEYKVAELKTAAIGINTEKCKFNLDFYAFESKEFTIFPWEKDDFPEQF
ncbi:hypothetical protein A3B18_02015 [Candidatus Giovannonibacteria bacterium RIFCSPLOWO2_01_FULL_46_13]|uniref:Phosphoribosyltransferase domain-containing protein n=1 Tax=Candidatus Giovannonibacteria bacterium RIFCSPLOWO2_01_FULL_46_13 TaxID=1798352 RepID=A0A1F5X645_9BACT|nr:MAG: hypothetical protein A3B18_02015 [Candidatus Giovannonibacteria bacterium RIFCSPLOWO2_01_FULL_46_13]